MAASKFKDYCHSYQSFRLSVPYTPPSREFLPLEELVKFVPNLGYQLYFAASKSNLEILANVGILLLHTKNITHT